MGSGSSSEYSQEEYDSFSLDLYEFTSQQTCLLPDIGLDESLLTYSGLNSNAVLQDHSDNLVRTMPGYIQKMGLVVGKMTPVPNAVGLGALVISMIIELIIKRSSQMDVNSYSMIRNVFGEEKASSVRDKMSEYLKRHQMFMKNDRQLQLEIQRLEAQLSDQLTALRNSLQLDGQMSSRGFKIWVNGAAFHIQMLLHSARLNRWKPTSKSVVEIGSAIDLYLLDLEALLETYKTFKISTHFISYYRRVCGGYYGSFGCSEPRCEIENPDKNCHSQFKHSHKEDLCGEPESVKAYMKHMYTKYEPISGLQTHFLDVKQNLYSLINQRGSFTLPQQN